MGGGVRADPAQVLGGVAAALEAAERHRVTAHPQMAVRVAEAGQHQAAVQIGHARGRPAQAVQVTCAPNRSDPAARDRHGAGCAAGGIDGVHDPAAEDQIGLHFAMLPPGR